MTTLYVLEAGDSIYTGYSLRGVYESLNEAQHAADVWALANGYEITEGYEEFPDDTARWWVADADGYVTVTEVVVGAPPLP